MMQNCVKEEEKTSEFTSSIKSRSLPSLVIVVLLNAHQVGKHEHTSSSAKQ